MKAVVFYGVGDIRLAEQPDPCIRERTDAVVRITASAICGTDLHMVGGTLPGMKPGTILGHEAIGIVEELGPDVRNLKAGDRVVISSMGIGRQMDLGTSKQASRDSRRLWLAGLSVAALVGLLSLPCAATTDPVPAPQPGPGPTDPVPKPTEPRPVPPLPSPAPPAPAPAPVPSPIPPP